MYLSACTPYQSDELVTPPIGSKRMPLLCNIPTEATIYEPEFGISAGAIVYGIVKRTRIVFTIHRTAMILFHQKQCSWAFYPLFVSQFSLNMKTTTNGSAAAIQHLIHVYNSTHTVCVRMYVLYVWENAWNEALST